ncbi:MAG: lipoyl(octanoyl) transferase LipB [Paludibacteraceae bacterium]|nr:lipoyl(octanoyl) transferase LipB [Paludibacteraceae bacterium]
MKFVDWGVIPYRVAWQQQQQLFAQSIENKQKGLPTDDVFIFCEHPSVFTLGRHGNPANMLLNEAYMKQMQVELVQIDRGGDITYHGPGQIVGYPIVDLDHYRIGLKDYIHRIEEIIICTIARWGIQGQRMAGATGVWIDVGRPTCRKIAAIGVRSSKYVTMHGFALNVNTDLNYFRMINPCGFTDKAVCSMQSETKQIIDMEQVRQTIRQYAEKQFFIP